MLTFVASAVDIPVLDRSVMRCTSSELRPLARRPFEIPQLSWCLHLQPFEIGGCDRVSAPARRIPYLIVCLGRELVRVYACQYAQHGAPNTLPDYTFNPIKSSGVIESRPVHTAILT